MQSLSEVRLHHIYVLVSHTMSRREAFLAVTSIHLSPIGETLGRVGSVDRQQQHCCAPDWSLGWWFKQHATLLSADRMSPPPTQAPTNGEQ